MMISIGTRQCINTLRHIYVVLCNARMSVMRSHQGSAWQGRGVPGRLRKPLDATVADNGAHQAVTGVPHRRRHAAGLEGGGPGGGRPLWLLRGLVDRRVVVLPAENQSIAGRTH